MYVEGQDHHLTLASNMPSTVLSTDNSLLPLEQVLRCAAYGALVKDEPTVHDNNSLFGNGSSLLPDLVADVTRASHQLNTTRHMHSSHAPAVGAFEEKAMLSNKQTARKQDFDPLNYKLTARTNRAPGHHGDAGTAWHMPLHAQPAISAHQQLHTMDDRGSV